MSIFGQIPVHKSNLIPRGKRVNKNYIHIVQTGDYVRGWTEVWKRVFGNWYIWKETRKTKV
jgi:hypothetical protein